MPEFIITNIRIETDKHKRLKHIAVDNGVSFTELIRRVIDGFLEGEGALPATKPAAKPTRTRVDRKGEPDEGDSGRLIIR